MKNRIFQETRSLFPPSSSSSLAMFNITVFIALLLSSYLSLAIAIPLERRTDGAPGVITKCTVPNTVALTFVRRSCLPPVKPFTNTHSPFFPSIFVADLFFILFYIFSSFLFQDDGPYNYLYEDDNSS